MSENERDDKMALDLWWREDVVRILASTQETMLAAQAMAVVNEDYQQGFMDALRSVAVAFGVAYPSATTQRKSLPAGMPPGWTFD